MSDPQDVTRLLLAAHAGDEQAHAQLLPLVYDELRRRAGALMRRERAGHTLQPTALVHEAYLRMIRQEEALAGRSHFFALSAQMMRRVLVDHARGRGRHKRGGDQIRVELDEKLKLSVERDHDVLALDEALQRLAELDPRQAQIVELRFFGGLTVAEVAEVLQVSKRTVEAEWTMIKAWLRRELTA
ncbi:MAG: sigma-70 family RNA polymerase sigma factor [Myxococcales bacterium]|nr:sigma-70 family RNA polymerase sigma factor [Myxococcales bacterium]